jgi:hypothetical protein
MKKFACQGFSLGSELYSNEFNGKKPQRKQSTEGFAFTVAGSRGLWDLGKARRVAENWLSRRT